MKFIKQIAKPAKFLATALDGTTRVEKVLTADKLRKVADTGSRMLEAGLKIYAPWKHDFANPQGPLGPKRLPGSDENAGFWNKLWYDEKEEALYGEIDVPREEDASKIGTVVQEVSPIIKTFTDGLGRTWEDAPYHIALVTHPILPGQENFKPVEPAIEMAASIEENDGFAFSMSDVKELLLTSAPVSDENVNHQEGIAMATAEPTKEEPTAEEPNVATGAGISSAIKALAKLKISLPEDTTPENFIERLVIAINAIDAANEPDDEGKPPVEQPLPVAMSLGEPIVADTPAVNPLQTFAENQARKSYIDRIEAVVKTGRIPPAYAVKELKPLVEAFALSLGEDGTPKKTVLDQLLEAIESIPENTILNVSGTAKASKEANAKKGIAFSFEEPLPEGLEGASATASEDEALKAADEQIARMEGRAPSAAT